MVFEIIILGILIGKLKGGHIKKLENINIRAWYLLVLSFLLEIIALMLITRTDGSLSEILESNFFFIHIFIYSLLIIGLSMNFNELGFRISLFGAMLNFLPLIFNKGQMPVSIKALENAHLYEQINLLTNNRIMTHSLMSDSTNLSFLGDIIAIARPYPFPKIISIGDILISLGLFLVIYKHMTKREKNMKEYIEIFKS